jgi:hypothetical protein
MYSWNCCNSSALRGGDDFQGDSVHVNSIVDLDDGNVEMDYDENDTENEDEDVDGDEVEDEDD